MHNEIEMAWRAASNKLTEIGTVDALAARAELDLHRQKMDAALKVGHLVKAMEEEDCSDARLEVKQYIAACKDEHDRRRQVHFSAEIIVGELIPPPEEPPTEPPVKPPSRPEWHISPRRYIDPQGNEFDSEQPIQDVIGANTWSTSSRNRPRKCTPGDHIILAPGRYRHFRVTHTPDREDPRMISIAGTGHGEGLPVIIPNPVGGSHTLYLENSHQHQLANLTIEGSDLSAIKTERPASRRFDSWPERPAVVDLSMRNVNVDGLWDFTQSIEANLAAGKKKTKWGLHCSEIGKSTREGRVGFLWSASRMRGIYREQFNYVRNMQGSCTWRWLTMHGCGRSAWQFTGRHGEGPDPQGLAWIDSCSVVDACLQMGGGGSAISVNGNGHDVLVSDTKVSLGCTKGLHSDYNGNITGCLTSHTGDSAGFKPNKRVRVERCEFAVGSVFPGKGNARRPNVMIRDTELFELIDSQIIQHRGAHEIALQLGDNIGKIRLDPNCRIEGKISYKGEKFSGLANFLAAHPELRA